MTHCKVVSPPRCCAGRSIVGSRADLETQARLFDAAVAGISRSSSWRDVSAIATAAGGGERSLHFPTKEHVLVELERNEEARIVAELRREDRSDDWRRSPAGAPAAAANVGWVPGFEATGLHFSSTDRLRTK
jgi:hypothetical protein